MSAAAIERDVLVIACALSAGIHAALAPSHLADGDAAAASFGFSAFALAAAAVALTWRPTQLVVAAAATVLTGLLVAYALALTSGVPIVHPQPEALDGLGLFTKAVEASGLVAALHLLRPKGARAWPHRHPNRSRSA